MYGCGCVDHRVCVMGGMCWCVEHDVCVKCGNVTGKCVKSCVTCVAHTVGCVYAQGCDAWDMVGGAASVWCVCNNHDCVCTINMHH